MPSLFDKLSDDNPTVQEEVFTAHTRDEFKDSIRKDLSILLNSRLTIKIGDVRLPSQYGIYDFESIDINNSLGRARFQNHIKETIEYFEPRLQNIEVIFLGHNRAKASVGIQITADLVIAGLKEIFSFPMYIAH